jgi:hypothetical protein
LDRLLAQDEAAFNNGGWEIESSITINQTTITDLILSGGQYYGYGYGGSAGTGVGSLTTTPSDPSIDYFPIGNPDAGPDAGETAGQVRDDDITTLFVGLSGPNVRVKRIRSDIAHSAMTKDFVLQASSDQSELSNVRDVTQSINENCPPQPTCGGTSGTISSGASGASSGSAGIGSAGAVADGGAALGSAPSSTPNSSWGCRAAPSSTAGGPASAGGRGSRRTGRERRRPAAAPPAGHVTSWFCIWGCRASLLIFAR